MKLITFLGIFLLTSVSIVRADWFRDFNDGTLQELIVLDPFGSRFTIAPLNGNIRFSSNNNGGMDDSVLAYDPETFTHVSALVLIRYSTNPGLEPLDIQINAGLILHCNPNTLSGYVLLMNDGGYLQLLKAQSGAVTTICSGGFLQDVPAFTPTQDWWMRFEAVNEGGSVRLRGRVWPDGTSEDCSYWQVECVHSNQPYLSGVTSLLVNEDANGSFIDLDNVSSSGALSCQEVCDNGIDDNGNGQTDCRDPQCASAGACACHTPFADGDGDGDVDMDDFGLFQRCYTGPGGHVPGIGCGCLDRDDIDHNGHFSRAIDGDDDVDADDLAAFHACFSGPGIPADLHCGE